MSELDHSPCREEVLRAEIERLRALEDRANRCAKGYDNLQAEIGRLQAKCQQLRKLLKDALHHVTTEGDDTLAFEIRRALEEKASSR
jgi:hypothetical protein